MSSNCPQCSQPIDQDFGVATCPKCGAVLFVDMDGQVQLTKNEPLEISQEAVPESISTPPIEQSFEDNWILEENPVAKIPTGPPSSIQDADFANIESDQAQADHAQPDQGQAPAELTYDSNYDSHQSEQEPSAEFQPTEMEAAAETGMVSNIEAAEIQSEEVPEINSESSGEEESFELIGDTVEEEVPAAESPGFTDVADFANSDQAYGPLSYSVIIENIDTKETRAQLQDALSDSKFQWDAKALMKEIKMGKLKLEGINPVKVSVLIERLQDIPVKVSWTQHAYS